MDEPLEMLVRHGFIREVEQARNGPGRKPSPKYDVNPLWIAQNTQNAQNRPGEVNSAYCAQTAQGVTV
jgi:hypothetical protein